MSKALYLFAILAFAFSVPTSFIEAQSSDNAKKEIKYNSEKRRLLTFKSFFKCWCQCDF